MQRLLWGMVTCVLMAGPAAWADISVEHVKVGCIVADKFPKINACFDPADDLARARVYFTLEGLPHWYFIETKKDPEVQRPGLACHTGILPKPKKSLVGKRLKYYVEAVDKGFAESRSAEGDPEIVPNAGACRKDTPVAPFVSKASVAVGSVAGAPLPAALAAGAGVSSGVIIGSGIVIAGAGAGFAASQGGNDTTPTTPTTGGGNVPPPPPPPTMGPPPTPPSPPPVPESCVFSFSVDPDPPEGKEPLDVTFDMCATRAPGGRTFTFDFESDGIVDVRGRACSASRRYTTDRVVALPSTLTPTIVSWTATVSASCDGTGLAQAQTYEVKVEETGVSVRAVGDAAAAVRRLAWTSQLQVVGGRGQVVVNGAEGAYAAAGRSVAVAAGVKGDNRIEAQLVGGSKPGTWTFNLGATGSLQRGSLRVIAGEVALVSADTVVFRMSGTPGERVVFAFKTQ